MNLLITLQLTFCFVIIYKKLIINILIILTVDFTENAQQG